MYDIDVSFEVNQSISDRALGSVNTTTFNSSIAYEIKSAFHGDESNAYMFITTESDDGDLGEASSKGGPTSPKGQDGFGTVIYSGEFSGSAGSTEHLRGFRKTTVHEVGHLLGTGRADDDGGEVYNGRSSDKTPEAVIIAGQSVTGWGVHSSGYPQQLNNPPVHGLFAPFSLESISTINFNRIDSVTRP